MKLLYTFTMVVFFSSAILFAPKPTTPFMPANSTIYSSSFPYITGSTIRLYCNHILDAGHEFNPTSVKTGDTIFIMIDFLDYFFEEYHPKINKPYIIVTAHFFDESDDDMPGKFASWLEDDKLAGWFTHNADIIHPKIYPMPIGIACAHYNYGNTQIFDKCIQEYSKNTNKSKLLYMNFSLRSSNKKCADERISAYNYFKNQEWCTNTLTSHLENAVYRKTMNEYLKEISQHNFVLSPRGNGLDCFRTWETLLMGSYPVVISSTLDPLFSDLPVVIVKSWNDLTQDFLEQKYSEFSQKKFNFDKLYMPYWLKEIEKVQNNIRNG